MPKSCSMSLSQYVVIFDQFAAVSELLVLACFRSSGRGGSTLIPEPVSTRNLLSLCFSIRYKTHDLCDTSAMTRDTSSQSFSFPVGNRLCNKFGCHQSMCRHIQCHKDEHQVQTCDGTDTSLSCLVHLAHCIAAVADSDIAVVWHPVPAVCSVRIFSAAD